MLTYALLSFLKSTLQRERIINGMGAMLVLTVVADVAIVGLVVSAFWGCR